MQCPLYTVLWRLVREGGGVGNDDTGGRSVLMVMVYFYLFLGGGGDARICGCGCAWSLESSWTKRPSEEQPRACTGREPESVLLLVFVIFFRVCLLVCAAFV